MRYSGGRKMGLGSDIDARLPLYTYLRPLIAGRRVLEIGGRTRPGAEALLRLGATSVVALVDDGALTSANGSRIRWLPSRTPLDALISAGPYDVVMLPEAGALLAPRGPVQVADLERLLAADGQLVVCAPSADQRHAPARDGLGYYELQEALSERFPVVRMFGQTPFAALGIAEFDADVADLRVEADLIDPDAEEPSHYVAVAGQTAGPVLGYALVQMPSAQPVVATKPLAAPAFEAASPSAASELAQKWAHAESQLKALSTKLLDAQGQAEGSARVARAQSEEIEELRARVRRAAETRIQLDEEIARLRSALALADESVLNLTRRTADEVSALAARFSSTLAATSSGARSPSSQGDAGSQALADRLKQREAQLAQRESALFDRDERIAALEAEKQDLIWQLGAASLHKVAAPQTPVGASARERELEQLLLMRDRAMQEFRQAASVHIAEVDRLRGAVSEQAAHVNELEDALMSAEANAQMASKEAESLRAALKQAQEADRSRRARLSELEGTLLRMRHETNRPKADDAELVLARRRVAELESRLAMMEAALNEAERGRSAATNKWNEAVERLMGLEQQTQAERLVVKEAQDNVEQVARVAEEDVNRLRQALERSEDQLRKARGQLLPLRGRVAMLEREKEARDVAEREFARSLLDEVSGIEQGLREELVRIDELSREVAHARAIAGASSPGREPFVG